MKTRTQQPFLGWTSSSILPARGNPHPVALHLELVSGFHFRITMTMTIINSDCKNIIIVIVIVITITIN